MSSHLVAFDAEQASRQGATIPGLRLVSLGEIMRFAQGVGRVIGFKPTTGMVLIEMAPDQHLFECRMDQVEAAIHERRWTKMEMPDLAFVGVQPPQHGGRVVVLSNVYGNDAGGEGEVVWANEFNGQVQVKLMGIKVGARPYPTDQLRRSFLSKEVLPVLTAEYLCTPVIARAHILGILSGETKGIPRDILALIPPTLVYAIREAKGSERKFLAQDFLEAS